MRHTRAHPDLGGDGSVEVHPAVLGSIQALLAVAVLEFIQALVVAMLKYIQALAAAVIFNPCLGGGNASATEAALRITYASSTTALLGPIIQESKVDAVLSSILGKQV